MKATIIKKANAYIKSTHLLYSTVIEKLCKIFKVYSLYIVLAYPFLDNRMEAIEGNVGTCIITLITCNSQYKDNVLNKY